jgi:hypothetical protein
LDRGWFDEREGLAVPNPFPGIDPYVEGQLTWRSFHTAFLTHLHDAIAARIPDRYDVDIEGEFSLVAHAMGEGRTSGYPDVRVTVDPLRTSAPEGGTALAIEPVTVPLVPPSVEEIAVHRWIEIRHRPDRVLVALIELLSPSNRAEPGFSEYARKRQEWIGQPVHLVELDFLTTGLRPPLGGPLPPADFYAFVSRADRRMDCEVYAWSVRQAIPTIPLPLDPPDPDLLLDLAAVYAMTHENGCYYRKIRPDEPLKLPLTPDDLAWAEARALPGN